MKDYTVQQLVSSALQGLEQSGVSRGYLKSYKGTGFAPFVKYSKENAINTCTDELISAVNANVKQKYENGSVSIRTQQLIHQSGEILLRLRDCTNATDLRSWVPNPLHCIPSEEELDDPNNIFGLVWHVKKELQQFGFSKHTLKSYQSHGFYQLLEAYHNAGMTEYSETFNADFVSRNREAYESGKIHRIRCQQIRKAASMLKEYYSTGTLSWQKLPHFHLRNLGSKHADLMTEFAHYLATLGNLRESTQHDIKQRSRKFLLDLEDAGIDCISKLTLRVASEQLIKFTENVRGGLRTTLYWLRVLFRFLFDTGKTPINLCVAMPDNIPYRKPIIEGFTEPEVERLLSSADLTTATGKRDFAIILLASKTGLRACDIANLKRTDIDWRSKEIRIVQEKNERPLALPLPIDVGNAIAEYILNARPESNEPHVFLTSLLPIRPLQSGSLVSIVSRTMIRADVVDAPSRGRKFHSLRRHFGRQLLESGVSLDMLREMLGQTHINSVKPYVATFEDDLKACALNLVPLRGTAE